MTRYVLGLRRADGQTDHATSHSTAARTIKAVAAWRADGGIVTVILRAGQPIDDRMLLRDAQIDRHVVDHLRRPLPSRSKATRP